jgi:copper oxidase (laccase) domain-containing protein
MEKIRIDSKGLITYCSQLKDGNMSSKYGNKDEVRNNVKNFYNSIGIPLEKCHYMKILNSDTIYDMLDESSPSEIETDSVIITKPDVYIYLAFGDCIPFVIYDFENKILGFAHLGWKSICAKLHIKLINKMMEKYKSNVKNIKIQFGPSVLVDSYAFSNPAQKDMEDWRYFVHKKNDMFYIDLVGYIVNDIKNLGILEPNIFLDDNDTAIGNLYFSHYRSMHNPEFPEGRFIFGAGIKKS